MPTSRSNKKSIIITLGDPRGIGPEITLNALTKFSRNRKISFTIIGDYGVFQNAASVLKRAISPSSFDFIDLKNAPFKKIHSSYGDKICGRASMEYISCAVSLLRNTKNSALVTSPISKAAANKAGYKFGGHTEFLSRLTDAKNVTMMLVGGNLRVSLVTRHLPLRDVAKCLTREKVIKTVENTHAALKNFFKIPFPKIGVASLNPHGGEKGLLGSEEKIKILPAVNYLRKRFTGIIGPLPADTLFYKAYKGGLDAVCCMYHDQGLIPLKMVAFDKGVNLTLGLPFIRTSPDHGTAFDIAGKGKANPSSMIEAIKLAEKLS